MWAIEVLKESLLQDEVLLWIFCVATAALFFGLLTGARLRSAGVYAVWSFTVGGGVYLVSLGRAGADVCLSFLLVIGGGAYLALFFLLRFCDKIRQRKAERERAGRAIQFTLPDKENSFVRARLHTALCVEGQDEKREGRGENESLPLRYAQKLIAALRAAALSQADRLAFEETAKLLALYQRKTKWSDEDTRIVNEALASLVKTSAKYSI